MFYDVGLEAGCDLVFEDFGVHEGKGVVIVHDEDGVTGSPEAESGAVDYVGEASLRVISNCFPKGVWIVTSAKEMPFASGE